MLILLAMLTGGCAATSGFRSEVTIAKDNYQLIALTPFSLRKTTIKRHPTRDTTWAIASGETVFGFLDPTKALLESFAPAVLDVDLPVTCSDPGRLEELPGGEIRLLNYSPDCRWRLNGKVDVERRQAGAAAGRLTVSLEQLKLQIKEREIMLSGEMKLIVQGGEPLHLTAVYDLQIQLEDGRIFTLKDLTLTRTIDPEQDRIALAGKVGHPQFGMARIETDSPLRFERGAILPFDGVLYFHGTTENWVRIYFPMASKPGFFRVDTEDDMETMGYL